MCHGPKGWGSKSKKKRTPKVGPRRVGPPKCEAPKWGPKGWGPKGWGPRRGRRPKFRVFFPLSRPYFRSFCLSLGVFSWNFPVGRIVCRETGLWKAPVWLQETKLWVRLRILTDVQLSRGTVSPTTFPSSHLLRCSFGTRSLLGERAQCTPRSSAWTFWNDRRPAEEDEVRSVGGVEDVASEAEEEVTFQLPGVCTRRAGFVQAVVMEEEFDERACVMKSVPRFLRGPYRIAMRVALEEIESVDDTRRELGWKLFLLLPRLLLHRSPRGGTIPRSKLLKRFDLFNRGEWICLLEASRVCCDEAVLARRRRGRRAENGVPSRISRAEALVHMGEPSARQALEGSALAPGSEATLNALRDPLKRPPVPRDPMPRHLAHPEGRVSFNLDETKFARNLRSAKRGATGGPSRMTVEHLQPLLDHPRDLQRFFRACEQLARAQIPLTIQACIRLARLVIELCRCCFLRSRDFDQSIFAWIRPIQSLHRSQRLLHRCRHSWTSSGWTSP